jgi:Predicted membrane protein
MANYFSYEGRLNRWPYFLRYIGCIVANFALVIILGIIAAIMSLFDTVIGYLIVLLISLVALVIGLAIIVFMLMQSIQRLHDLDKSGWYLLIRLANFIPLIGWIIVLAFDLYLFLAEGTAGPNRFGPDPLGREAGRNYNAASLNSEVVDADYENVDENEKQ